jgi:hypothetical protein
VRADAAFTRFSGCRCVHAADALQLEVQEAGQAQDSGATTAASWRLFCADTSGEVRRLWTRRTVAVGALPTAALLLLVLCVRWGCAFACIHAVGNAHVIKLLRTFFKRLICMTCTATWARVCVAHRRRSLVSAARKVWAARRHAEDARLADKLSRFPGTPSVALVRKR